jgi:hypothetical protein
VVTGHGTVFFGVAETVCFFAVRDTNVSVDLHEPLAGNGMGWRLRLCPGVAGDDAAPAVSWAIRHAIHVVVALV